MPCIQGKCYKWKQFKYRQYLGYHDVYIDMSDGDTNSENIIVIFNLLSKLINNFNVRLH